MDFAPARHDHQHEPEPESGETDMPELCATLDGETVCMPLDLTVFEDPRQGDVPERPGDAPGELETTDGTPRLRTRVAWGAVPDAWPRDEPVAGELVKGQERVPCELLVRSARDARHATGAAGAAHPGSEESEGAAELVLVGEEVYRTVLGRSP